LPYPLHFYHAIEQKGYGKPYPYNQAAPRDQCHKLDVTAHQANVASGWNTD